MRKSNTILDPEAFLKRAKPDKLFSKLQKELQSNSDFLNNSNKKQAEDWSSLAHQVLGYESY